VKRAPFLGAAAATVLAGCGGHSALRSILPGATSSGTAPSSGPLTLVPQAADTIPASVLANPFMGEAWRFDGATVPPGWLALRGATLNVADNRPLFSIIGTIGGGDGRTTFKLPNLSFGVIISAAGAVPSGPAFLAGSKRSLAAGRDSLPASARHLGARTLSPRAAALLAKRTQAIAESQRLSASALRASPSSVRTLSGNERQRIDQVQADARGVALGGLSPANRDRVEGLVDAILAGRTSVKQATVDMSASLSPGEAQSLLAVFDGTQRTLRQGWAGMEHPSPQVEAGRYVVSIAFSADQLRALKSMPLDE